MVMFHVEVFWVVTLCSVVLPQQYMASQHRRSQLDSQEINLHTGIFSTS
jgi:hypothetical protein